MLFLKKKKPLPGMPRLVGDWAIIKIGALTPNPGLEILNQSENCKNSKLSSNEYLELKLPLTVGLRSMVRFSIYFDQFYMVEPAFCNGAFPKAPKVPLQESTSANLTNSNFLKLRRAQCGRNR